MEDEAFLRRLPQPYATAIGLHRDGATHATISSVLGIEIESVPALLEIALAKLDSLLRTP